MYFGEDKYSPKNCFNNSCFALWGPYAIGSKLSERAKGELFTNHLSWQISKVTFLHRLWFLVGLVGCSFVVVSVDIGVDLVVKSVDGSQEVVFVAESGSVEVILGLDEGLDGGTDVSSVCLVISGGSVVSWAAVVIVPISVDLISTCVLYGTVVGHLYSQKNAAEGDAQSSRSM